MTAESRPTPEERDQSARELVERINGTPGILKPLTLEDAYRLIDEFHTALENAEPAPKDFPIIGVLGLRRPQVPSADEDPVGSLIPPRKRRLPVTPKTN